MVGRSNEANREICQAQDADSEPSKEQRGTLLTMAQALRRHIARRKGANKAVSAMLVDAT